MKKTDPADKIDSSTKKYRQSNKGKDAQKRYLTSEKGTAAREAYAKSEKGLAAQLRYRLSKKGQEALKESQTRRKLFTKAANWLKENPGKSLEDYLSILKENHNGR